MPRGTGQKDTVGAAEYRKSAEGAPRTTVTDDMGTVVAPEQRSAEGYGLRHDRLTGQYVTTYRTQRSRPVRSERTPAARDV